MNDETLVDRLSFVSLLSPTRGFCAIAAKGGASIGICVLLTLGLLLFAGGCDNNHSSSSQAFQSKAWKQAKGAKAIDRKGMVDDLLSRHKIEGMTKEQTIQLLGEPDAKNRFRDADDFNYSLGAERGYISIDTEWLTIYFGEGRAEKAVVTTD